MTLKVPSILKNLHVTQAHLIALVSQAVALIVGFGIVNNTTAAIWANAAIGAINAAFLIANSIHALAHAQVAAPKAIVPELEHIAQKAVGSLITELRTQAATPAHVNVISTVPPTKPTATTATK